MNDKTLSEMRKIMNRHDPIRIYFGKKVNFDEYDPKINEIYKTFKKSKNLDDFTIKVHKIFQKWFSSDLAGNKEIYISLSRDLFNLLTDKNKK